MKSIRKALRYIKAEGLLRFIDTSVRQVLILTGLKKSVTFFFKKEIFYQEVELNNLFIKHYQRELLKNLPAIGLIFNHPIEEWENNGCDVFCTYDTRENPVSYLVFHDKFYLLNSFTRFICKENESFASPSFVKKEYRGQKINRIQIKYAFNFLYKNKNINVVYACIRGDNYSSLSSVLPLGFELVGIVTYRLFFKKLIYQKISEISGKNEIKDRIQFI